MNDKFLKLRISVELYQTLLACSGSEGKRLGTKARELLESGMRAIATDEALTRIEAAITAATTGAAPAQPAVPDHELRRELTELRLIARELALHHNAQILSRVAAQLATQAPQAPQPSHQGGAA